MLCNSGRQLDGLIRYINRGSKSSVLIGCVNRLYNMIY